MMYIIPCHGHFKMEGIQNLKKKIWFLFWKAFLILFLFLSGKY